MKNDLKERIAVARGLKKADLVLKGGRVANVLTGELLEADVAVHRGVVAGLGAYRGRREIDVSGRIVLPGLVDSHLHIESSMLSPREYAKAAVPHGVTAVVADPHEIANVLGARGLRFLLDATEGLPLDFFFMLPSCVPPTDLATSGARLDARDLMPFLKHPRVLGLAEVMNYPGVLSRDRGVLEKMSRFQGSVIDGHAPGLTGKDLSAYVGAGISSDHECVSAEEALEKARLGMTVMVREGSSAKNLEAILPVITPENAGSFCFCTDDLSPGSLLQGSIDAVVRKAIRLGFDPLLAVRMATLNPARHFRLHGRGAVAPGYGADIVVIEAFDAFTVQMVFKAGRLVASDGVVRGPAGKGRRWPFGNTVRVRPFDVQDIRLPARGRRARVIEIIPDQIETRETVLPVTVRDGCVVPDPGRDILKLIVVERHRATGNIGIGLVRGLGLRSGALASTVAHDSHNIIAAGVHDADMLRAVDETRRMHGGLAVVERGRVLASLPLPLAGLMSDRPVRAVAELLEAVNRAARELGTPLDEPFAVMAFLALPVIPHLKLTDRGLVDVARFAFTDLFVR